MVEITVETMAMITLFHMASAISASVNTALYQRSENPSHSVKRDALKLNRMSVASGRCRKRYAAAA